MRNKAKPRHNPNKRARQAADPEDEQPVQKEIEAVAEGEETESKPAEEAPKEEVKEEPLPEPVGNILFQPLMPAKAAKGQKVVPDDSSEAEEAEDSDIEAVAYGGQGLPMPKGGEESSEAEEQEEESEAEEGGDDGDDGAEGGEEEMTESDCEVSDSDEDLQVTGNLKVQKQHAEETSEEEEETKTPAPVQQTKHQVPATTMINTNKKKKKSGKGEVDVDFQYVVPSEAYYHSVKALLNQFIDAPDADTVNLQQLTDHICERTSIGQVVGAPLEASRDPEMIPEFQKLSDAEFQRLSVRYYAERDVFAFSSILSLTWNKLRGRKQQSFLKGIQAYSLEKAEKYCNKGQFEEFKRIVETKNIGLLLAERMINLPALIVPSLHTELPADLAFTKEQDDIQDPKEFDYEYLMVMSRYTVPVQKREEAAAEEKLYYKWEDQVLWPISEVSYTFKATFYEVDEDGNRKSYTGSRDGKEVQHRLVYLIKFDRYLQEIKKLAKMCSS